MKNHQAFSKMKTFLSTLVNLAEKDRHNLRLKTLAKNNELICIRGRTIRLKVLFILYRFSRHFAIVKPILKMLVEKRQE